MELQQNSDWITDIHRRDDGISEGVFNLDQDPDAEVRNK
jgi:hypothetical protein